MIVSHDELICIEKYSEMHYLIIILSILSVTLAIVLYYILRNNKFDNIKTKLSKAAYGVCVCIFITMVMSPSNWLQYVFMLDGTKFYHNAVDTIILVLNSLVLIILPHSLLVDSLNLKIISLVALPLLFLQIINPSMMLYSSGAVVSIANYVSIIGYCCYLIFFSGLSVYLISDIIYKRSFKFIDVITTATLILPILFPYIILSRLEMAVKRLPSGELDLVGLQGGIRISKWSIAHIVFVLINILIFTIYTIYIQKKYREAALRDILLIMTAALIYTVISRRASYLYFQEPGFYLLPDSPCAMGVFIVYIGLLFRHNICLVYSFFISLVYTSLNNLMLFQGDISNIFNYLVLDSVLYHLNLAIIVFNVIKVKIINVNTVSILKSWGLFIVIYLIFVLLGNIQTLIENIYGIDLLSTEYIGFFYRQAPFSFLTEFCNLFSYSDDCFNIMPMNWLLTIISTLIGEMFVYFMYTLYIKLRLRRKRL